MQQQKDLRFCQQDGLELTSNTPVWYNKSVFSCEALNGSGLLKSLALYAAGWQRGCTAIGSVCLRSSAKPHLADVWQLYWKMSWLWVFERESNTSEGLQAHYQHTVHCFCATLEKACLKEMPRESDQGITFFFHTFSALVQPWWLNIPLFLIFFSHEKLSFWKMGEKNSMWKECGHE